MKITTAPTIAISPALCPALDRVIGTVNFDALIKLGDFAEIRVPSVLMFPDSIDLTAAFFEDIQGYVGVDLVKILQSAGLKFDRVLLTPEIMATILT